MNPADWPEMPLEMQFTALRWYPNRGPPGTCIDCGDKVAALHFTAKCPACMSRDDEMLKRHFIQYPCRQCNYCLCQCGAKDIPNYRCRYKFGHKGACKPPDGEQ